MKQEHLETSKRARVPIRDRLRGNLDVVVLVLCVGLFAMQAARSLFPKTEGYDAARSAVAEAHAGVRDAITAARADVGASVRELEAAAATVRATWGPLPGAAPPGKDTDLVPAALLAARREGRSNEIVFPAPAGVAAEAEKGLVSLTWTTAAESNVPVAAFVVERREGAAEPREIARIPAPATSYEDTAVVAGLRYVYRVGALTVDPLVAAQGIERSPFSEPVSITAVEDFRIKLEDANPAEGVAMLLVEKWADGAWRPRMFSVKVGDEIGRLDEGSGIDFATGRRLKELTERPATRSTTRQVPRFDGSGHVVFDGGVMLTEEVSFTDSFVEVKARVEGGSLPPEDLLLEKR